MILNTQQIILLCLLVSFVTSIATGITVVSLLQQAPEPVTQTINRVIERTVETVTQQPIEDIKNIITQQPQAPKPSKEVVTVVVNQEDQTINAVEKNESSIVRIHTNNKSQDFVTIGVVLNQSGDVAVDKRLVDKKTTYKAKYNSREFTVKYVQESETADFIILRVIEENPNDFVFARFDDSNTLKLGQSVISLSGALQTSVSTGEISILNKTSDGSLTSIKTSVNSINALTGSVLLNLSGSIVGVRVSTNEDRTVFMPSNTFKSQLSL